MMNKAIVSAPTDTQETGTFSLLTTGCGEALRAALSETQRKLVHVAAVGIPQSATMWQQGAHTDEFMEGAECAAWFASQLLDPRLAARDALHSQLMEEQESGRHGDWLQGFCAGVDRLSRVEVSAECTSADQRQQMALRVLEAKAEAVADEATNALDRAEELAEVVAALSVAINAALIDSSAALISVSALGAKLARSAAESVKAAALIMELAEGCAN